MESDLKWLVGLVVAILAPLVGALIAAFRNLAGRISRTSSELHKRVDDVKEKYVRRDDLDGHLSRIDESIRDVRHELREQHQQVLDAIKDSRSH